MTFYCPARESNYLSGFGFAGYGDNAPVGEAATGYYKAGTKFLWFAPSVDVGFALALDPWNDALNSLRGALAAKQYKVSVISGERGGALEVSGFQSIDRSSATDIRDQINGFVQAAGFDLGAPIQFNVEAPALSSWQVGSAGAAQVFGDKTPVATKNIFDELSIPNIAGDLSFAGGTTKNIAIYAGLGLLAFFLISKAIK